VSDGTALYKLELADGTTRLARGPAGGEPADLLPASADLDALVAAGRAALGAALAGPVDGPVPAGSRVRAPLGSQEVWAAGVTYRRSREARMSESVDADCYARVYEAERPEVFFKAPAWRVRGPGEAVCVRADSDWDVPEPELGIVVARDGAIAGYVIGNDVSSRSIEGANPLYLPQAKVYDGACAIGPAIVPAGEAAPPFTIRIRLERDGAVLYADEASTTQLKRGLEELAACVTAALTFPAGLVLLTGTCLVPPDTVTLSPGDRVEIEIPGLGVLANPVEAAGQAGRVASPSARRRRRSRRRA
jgi:2-dehydro-3-deoxy-D-arabinonate dehydratase